MAEEGQSESGNMMGRYAHHTVCVSLTVYSSDANGGKRVNWRQRIITDWPNDPQRAHKCREALRQIEANLLELSSLGHPLHIEEGYTPPPKPEWPKAMFHIYQGARVFNCQEDVDEAGPDWHPTMDDARHAAGVTKQNQRGGIFSRALPVVLPWFSEERVNEKALNEEANRVALAAKRQFISDMRAQHRAQKERGNQQPVGQQPISDALKNGLGGSS